MENLVDQNPNFTSAFRAWYNYVSRYVFDRRGSAKCTWFNIMVDLSSYVHAFNSISCGFGRCGTSWLPEGMSKTLASAAQMRPPTHPSSSDQPYWDLSLEAFQLRIYFRKHSIVRNSPIVCDSWWIFEFCRAVSKALNDMLLHVHYRSTCC